MPIRLFLLLALSALLQLPVSAQTATPAAQNASPTEVRVYAIGGFLGQLDGFCEQPGGTYQTTFIDQDDVQSCANKTGKQPDTKSWPVAFGGMLGAQTAVEKALAEDAKKEQKGVLPLVVVPGNNQVANFAFLEDAAVDPNSDYRADYRIVPPQAARPGDDRLTQTRARLRRFWQEMSKLGPQAIGLGPEDFIRSLRDPRDSAKPEKNPAGGQKQATDLNTKVRNRGSILHRFLRQVTDQGRSTRIPVIGSNVMIKTRGEKTEAAATAINDVRHGDFSLAGLVKQESIDWMKEIKVAHPAAPGIVLALWEMGPVGRLDAEQHVVTKTTDGTAESTTFESKDGTLKPGSRYEVRVRQGVASYKLKFQTHLALTPRTNSQDPEKAGGERRGFPLLDGFPVIARPLADGAPLMILSLVDPSVRKLLGEDAWKWEQEACANDADLCDWGSAAHKAGITCPAKECEIDFMSPEDAITAAILRSDPKGDRKPFILLLSALTATQNQELLEQFPEIRILVLEPDSEMLGRTSRVFSKDTKDLEKRLAARNTGDQAYSGDLGFSAMLNAAHPQGTTLVARPEWVGETLAQLKARVSYAKEAEWRVENGSIDVTPVPGAALMWQETKECPVTGAECTEFYVQWPNKGSKPSSYGSFPSYLVCDPKNLDPRLEIPEKDREAALEQDRIAALEKDPALADKCTMFAKLWTTEFSTFAGHTLRRATGSELTVVPGLLQDRESQAWLAPLIDKTRTRMLTRFILERSVLRSFRIVRAEVAGDALLATLAEALKSETYTDACVVGLSSGCDEEVDADAIDTARVNGRAIDSRSFYTVALPEGLAEELKVPYSKNNRHTADAVSALHERLNELNESEGWYLSGRKEDQLGQRIERRARNKYQFDFLTTALELGYTRLNPDDTLNDGNTLGALDVDFRGASKARTLTSKLDVDIALFDFSRIALRGISELDFNRRTDIKDDDIKQISYPDNTLTYGGRLDLKWSVLDREMRTYGGYFVERELEGQKDYLKAAETTTATLYQRKPLEFGYYAGGVDYLNVKKFGGSKVWVELSRASFQYGHGRLRNIPIGARINGFEQSFGDEGAEGVLKSYYARDPGSFDPKLTLFAVNEDPRKQHRLQTEFNFKRDFTGWKRKFKFDAESRWRFFPETVDTADDSLRRYLRLKLNLSLPLLPRVELVPSVEYHRARIKHAADGKETFTYSKIEANLKLPFVIRRAGWGWLAR